MRQPQRQAPDPARATGDAVAESGARHASVPLLRAEPTPDGVVMAIASPRVGLAEGALVGLANPPVHGKFALPSTVYRWAGEQPWSDQQRHVPVDVLLAGAL